MYIIVIDLFFSVTIVYVNRYYISLSSLLTWRNNIAEL